MFADCIREVRDGGRTVLLSSHILSEVENLCDRVTIIRQGRTIDTGTLADLRHLSASYVDVSLATPPPVLDGVAGVSRVQVDGSRLRCEVETEQVGELFSLLAPYGITSLSCQPPTLESLFLRHYDPGAAPPQPSSERVPA